MTQGECQGAEPISWAIVLAGGQSRRMGQDKALLAYEGGTFLEQILAALRTLTPHLLVVADRADKYTVAPVQCVADLFPDTGPVGGILTGLVAAGSGAHYVVPCDMPGLSPIVLARLHAEAAPEYDAIVPLWNGEPEPLIAVYRDTAAPKLQKYLAEGRRSARGALNHLHVRYLKEEFLSPLDPDALGFTNINTPEEFAYFRQRRKR